MAGERRQVGQQTAEAVHSGAVGSLTHRLGGLCRSRLGWCAVACARIVVFIAE
jgi:hypothetical protein